MAEFDPVCYQETVGCDSCECTENVYHYCIQCPGNICDTCKLTHCNTRLTRHHRILHRTHPEVQQSRLSTKVYCELHQDMEYVTFCTRCKVPCCPTCISKEHCGHTFSDLGEEIEKAVKEMNEIASDLEIYGIRDAENDIKTLSTATSDYKIAADKAKQSAEERIQQLHNDVDRYGRQFMDSLDSLTKSDLRQMEDMMKKVNENLSEIKRTAEFCRTAPADAALLMKRENVKRMMEAISPTTTLSYQMCPTFKESYSSIKEGIIGHFQRGGIMVCKGENCRELSRAEIIEKEKKKIK